MSGFGKLLRAGSLWSLGIYVADHPFTPELELGRPVKLFSSKRLRLFATLPHTQADPFLLADDESLYIFHERMMPGSPGEIACFRTNDLIDFEYLGVILDDICHLSWPFVFRAAGSAYMMPESSRRGEVSIYRFEALPGPLAKVRTLLRGDYADPILIEEDGKWYLFATSASGLELFVADDLFDGTFEPHPKSPVATDPRFSRSGGSPLRIDGKWLRIAQDCSRSYGENVNLIEIMRLTPDDYSEQLVRANFFARRDFWNRDGAHHLSVIDFMGKTVIATDGKHRDYWLNRVLGWLHARR